jgi:hypothetical protein
MKTVIRITAITIISVLAVLSCSDGVGLTQRDFKEIRDAKSPKYDEVTTGALVPTFSVDNLTYVAPPGTTTETQREMSISFPASADILKKDIKTADIKEFISMYTFKNSDSSYSEVSTKLDDVDFEFIRRVRQNEGSRETVFIRLITVPDRTFAAKIDATKYTFANGLKLDTNNDHIAGEAVYDDAYSLITPAGGTTISPYTQPRLTFSLTILKEITYTDTNLIEQNLQIATLSLGTYSSAERKAQQRAVIESLIPKIKFQKYDPASKTWTDTGTIKSVDPNSTLTTNDWYLAVNITPQDGDIYRTYASGMNNLTTSDDFLGVKQKIRVSDGIAAFKYTYNTIISDPIMFIDPTKRREQLSSPVDASYPIYVSSDSNGKNVKLEIYLKGIKLGALESDPTYWPEDIGNETFKKNVKLAYYLTYNETPGVITEEEPDPPPVISITTGDSITDFTSFDLKKIVFIPIKEVKYETHNLKNLIYPPNPLPKNNKITITLDPSYQLSKERDRVISLLLAPGFLYDNPIIFFGRYGLPGATEFIDGTNFWQAYGSITGSGGVLKL